MTEWIRVLHLDDVAADREMVRHALEGEDRGFKVIQAVSREELASRLAEGDFDVVISDFDVLGFKGLDIVDLVREKFPHVPLVTVTGADREMRGVEAVKQGAADYVIKSPRQLRHLPFTIQAVVEKTRLQDAYHRSQQAKRAAEEKYRMIAENAHDAIVLVQDGRTIYRNPAYEKLIGYTVQETEDRSFLEIVAPGYREMIREYQEKRLKGEPVPDVYEVDLITRGGDRVTMQVKATTSEYLGRPASAAIMTDVSAQKRAEKALQESEARYRSVFENAGTATVIIEEDTTISMANPEFERLSGYSRQEIECQKSWTEFVVPEDLEEMERYHRERRESGNPAPSEYEFRFVDRKGNIRHICNRVGMIPGTSKSVASLLDITGSKRAEEALRQSESELSVRNRINEIFLTMPGEEMYGEVLKVILEIMGSKYGIFGYIDRGSVWVCPSMTRDVWDQCRVPDKNIVFPREQWSGIWGRAMVARKTLYSNNPFNVPEGHIPITRALDVPIIFQREIIGNLLVGNKETDYTAKDTHVLEGIADKIAPVLYSRLQIERQRREKEQLDAQLLQAQKMESVGRLAGGVAHDFNNMLSVILGRTELALLEMDPKEPLHAKLEDVLKAAMRSADITRQLLAFARKQTISPKTLDLNETVEGMLKMLRRLIGEDIDLAWQPATNLWPVKMDPAQVDQILVNLCVNARDAIEGVGKITIETQNVILDETYCAEHAGFVPGKYVSLAVSDSGYGMDEQILDKIFEPFFTTKELGKGTGLGLSTVYGIVKQNQGFINVYSEPRKGTTFNIYLPRHMGEEEAGLEETREEMPRGRGETILIVEDEASVLDVAKQTLETLDYRVLAAESPRLAIEMARRYSSEIHLLITDLVMPGMSGKDLAEEITTIRPKTKTLFMSGYTATAVGEHGILDRGVHFLQKPFRLYSLAQKVREVLETD
jgi:PAS domain S-box-containing protein